MASNAWLSQEHDPIHGSRKLKVTILASEWGSTKGGLSTLRREVAIHLAKVPHFEVTFLLPKCSDEDKKAAASHGVSILEAARLPGYGELDWLSFPPENLRINVVFGHGFKLGWKAQFIRNFLKCSSPHFPSERKAGINEKNESEQLADPGSSVPAEIRARGPRAEDAFQKAMQTGKVKVYRGRIMLLGQDRAGKTSLRKSLLGLPFDPEQESTVGIEVDEVKNWMLCKKGKVSELKAEIARFIVRDLNKHEADDKGSTYPNVEKVKVRKDSHSGAPYSYRIVRGFFNVPQNYQHSRNCETGPPVYRPYPRRLESLPFADEITEAALSPQLFKDPECWSGRSHELTTSRVTARCTTK